MFWKNSYMLHLKVSKSPEELWTLLLQMNFTTLTRVAMITLPSAYRHSWLLNLSFLPFLRLYWAEGGHLALPLHYGVPFL